MQSGLLRRSLKVGQHCLCLRRLVCFVKRWKATNTSGSSLFSVVYNSLNLIYLPSLFFPNLFCSELVSSTSMVELNWVIESPLQSFVWASIKAAHKTPSFLAYRAGAAWIPVGTPSCSGEAPSQSHHWSSEPLWPLGWGSKLPWSSESLLPDKASPSKSNTGTTWKPAHH